MVADLFVEDALVARCRQATTAELLLAVDQVQTEVGARRIYYAEALGRSRRMVTRATERRIEQLRGTEAAGKVVEIVAHGIAVETESLAPRRAIVAGVGHGKMRNVSLHTLLGDK